MNVLGKAVTQRSSNELRVELENFRRSIIEPDSLTMNIQLESLIKRGSTGGNEKWYVDLLRDCQIWQGLCYTRMTFLFVLSLLYFTMKRKFLGLIIY